MTLSILDTIIDEEFRATQTGTADDDDVTLATFNASAFKTALTTVTTNDSLTFATGFSGFPQYAEQDNFVNIGAQVTDFSLTASGGGALTGVATDMYVGTDRIFLYSTSDPNIVVGRIGTGNTPNATGNVALVIGIEETTSGGFVTDADLWMALYTPVMHDGLNLVDSADTLDLTGLIYLKSNFDTTTLVPFENFNGVASGNNLFNVIFPSDGSSAVQLLLTGSAGESLSTVNVSSTGIGAGSQHIDVGSTLRVDTVSGMVQTNVDQAPEVNNSNNIDYTARVEIVAADFEISQVNPSSTPERVDIMISAFNAAGAEQEGSYLTDAIASDGVSVQIDAADVRILDDAGNDITAAWLALPNTEIIQFGDSVKILGLNDGASNSSTDGDRVAFTTDGVHFDRFLITNIDTSTTLDVANIHVTSVTGGPATESAELGSHLIVQDDGPKITASGATITALVADDSTLGTDPTGSFAGAFNAPDYGADVPSSSTVQYSLGISGTGAATNLVQTSTGDTVYLFLESGKVVGRSGDTALLAASGPIVFEISVNSTTGIVKLDQMSAVVHTNTASNDETSPAMTASLISITATVFDNEAATMNDSASVSVNVGDKFLFKDDGPVIDPSNNISKPNDLEVANKTDATGQDDSLFVLSPGNDGQQSFIIKGPADSSGDFTWQYFDVDGSGTAGLDEIKGFYKGSALYTLEINADGTYVFKMIGTLPGSTLDLNPAEVIKAGSPDTPTLEIGAKQNDDYVEMTGGGGNINESHGVVGVGNGNLDIGESITFRLFDGDDNQLTFQGIQIGTKSAQGGEYSWTATLVGGGTISSSVNEIVGKNGTIDISSLDLGGATIDSITIMKVSGSAIKIGVSDIHIVIQPDDVQLGFTAELKDGDNDTTTASFVVDIDGNNDGNYDSNVNALSALPTLKNAGFTSDSGMAPSSHSSSLLAESDVSSSLKVEALSYLHQPDYYFV